MTKAILFDLDGTLLPMDLETFTAGYFSLLAKSLAPLGYERDTLIKAVWKGTGDMIRNDGSMTNERRFWRSFADAFGEKVYGDLPAFDSFYRNEFREAVRFTAPNPEAAQKAVRRARSRAEKVVLATNPIFPLCGVETRLRWLGLSAADFDYVTTYENSSYCKPNPLYYTEILSTLGIKATEAVMIGNDAEEDIAASHAAGLRHYLVRDCLIDRNGIGADGESGSFEQLLQWL